MFQSIRQSSYKINTFAMKDAKGKGGESKVARTIIKWRRLAESYDSHWERKRNLILLSTETEKKIHTKTYKLSSEHKTVEQQ
jgi:hypothetical protein